MVETTHTDQYCRIKKVCNTITREEQRQTVQGLNENRF